MFFVLFQQLNTVSSGFGYIAEIPSLLRCATWSVKSVLFSGEMTIQSNIYLITWHLPKAFAETRWKNAEHLEKAEADSALVFNVQQISRFLIDCKKSQLFLWKSFKIEHAEYCCGFNFKMFLKLHAIIKIEKLEMPSCHETCWQKSPNWPIRILRLPMAAQIF